MKKEIMFQPLRHAAARFMGMKTPVCLRTPDVSSPRVSAGCDHDKEDRGPRGLSRKNDPERIYRRQPEREALVAEGLNKQRLF